MSSRELVVLGTSSAVPTRHRNHNGYFLRWDGQGFLFDPGEGTQRQMAYAGLSANDVHWLCVTHFHGDHCLGVPGVVQRIARDKVRHPVRAVFPASGLTYWQRLRHATAFADTDVITEHPLDGDHAVLGQLSARRLSHPVESYGYRIQEPAGRRMLPDRLAAHGIGGAEIGELQRTGSVRGVTLDQCSVPRPGQSFAFIMDTRLCDAVFELADRTDLLVVESTFLSAEEGLAREYGHLTAEQAGLVAARAGARRLVLTHFSERYGFADEPAFLAEARRHYDGDVVVARDLTTVPVPSRPRHLALG
ncbi:ribonuclease Z [Nonomuraea roseoviolacea subsp. roseoviolacea]|uniref:Ribonuclease Z n=1 Tax=Nonomuraea roseoviolacea subsp. carminata TaxID=160689 RepID=A0ABT1JSZ5_9ACTN|nr:ribonuclease Z [Nonomuraea roseoviolacea]MCP2344879.1 ribonuclease Z [Nonomuraea roseoviolacea subsp. carminata]